MIAFPESKEGLSSLRTKAWMMEDYVKDAFHSKVGRELTKDDAPQMRIICPPDGSYHFEYWEEGKGRIPLISFDREWGSQIL